MSSSHKHVSQLVDKDDDAYADDGDAYLHLEAEGHDFSTLDGIGYSSYRKTVSQSNSNSK